MLCAPQMTTNGPYRISETKPLLPVCQRPIGNQTLFSAGPSGKLCPVGLCGYLNFESSPSNRETNRDAWPAPGNPCSQVTFMLLDVLVYLQNTFHYGWFGPNCNTIARRLGERAGFTNIQQPPETPGWWYTSLPW